MLSDLDSPITWANAARVRIGQLQGDGMLPLETAQMWGTDPTDPGLVLRGRLRGILPGRHAGRNLRCESVAGFVHLEDTENSPRLIPVFISA